MPRRPSKVLDIEIEDATPEDVSPEAIDEPDGLEQQELEDFEGTDVNESEFIERL